jgi:uncharacterized protein (DUF2126 family)
MNKSSDALAKVAQKIEAALTAKGVELTLGGEPTFVPMDPAGAEWTVAALGPTKLRYGYAMAGALTEQTLPRAVTFYCPGKSYPGEANPRWMLCLLWNRDGSPLVRALNGDGRRGKKRPALPAALAAMRRELLRRLKLARGWLRGRDPLDAKRLVWILPLDHDGRRFVSEEWGIGREIELLRVEGPAGLRLPLAALPASVSRRAMTIEARGDELEIFLPPLLQRPFLAMVEAVERSMRAAGAGPARYSTYLPIDEAGRWSRLDLAADPGVLEVNLPPCATWAEYRDWMAALERAAASAGMRSLKQFPDGRETGTGGGNHLLLGGPTLDSNPLFTHPRWVASLLRYWQHHPSLSYLFTGQYVGPSSQAPRPDESASALHDLELAYRFLESLPSGDHRAVIGETLRHLHTDRAGNTHRSETSFDKFWNASFPGGCRGLMEFRALETLPRSDWMSAVALLWRALAARLLLRPFRAPLRDHGPRLHDFFFLPAGLWSDFEEVLRDLRASGFALPVEVFRSIADWRFPTMLSWRKAGAELSVRLAHEGWPLLCEQPLEGGSTSRFVDASIERLEISANRDFARRYRVEAQGRALELKPFPAGRFGAGLRYRRSALYPSLHPGITPHMPLHLVVRKGVEAVEAFKLEASSAAFSRCAADEAPHGGKPCSPRDPGLITCDLRIK